MKKNLFIVWAGFTVSVPLIILLYFSIIDLNQIRTNIIDHQDRYSTMKIILEKAIEEEKKGGQKVEVSRGLIALGDFSSKIDSLEADENKQVRLIILRSCFLFMCLSMMFSFLYLIKR